ncbi:ATP-binding cassette domain-containing protein [Rhodobacterales bacterium HKCCE2091]|nr:ATP-binding cassette domain-containing protein [Rhodobacterales bacterium HKCCE2091]
MSLIEARGLTLAYRRETVLSDVTFAIDRGEIVTVVGPNGSGKTSLVKALIGAVQPVSGKVARTPGLRIGYVPQRLHTDGTLPLTVRRFLSLPHRVGSEEAETALAEAGVPGLGPRALAELSGGQLQRVLLARALIGRPDLLILDEPTQGLDQPGQAAFYQRVEAVRDTTGAAVLLVSHDLHVVMSASDRVLCLNGHVCCEGRPEVVASAPEYRALFGTGTHGALALYRHDHDHGHDHGHGHHDHGNAHDDPAEPRRLNG